MENVLKRLKRTLKYMHLFITTAYLLISFPHATLLTYGSNSRTSILACTIRGGVGSMKDMDYIPLEVTFLSFRATHAYIYLSSRVVVFLIYLF